MGLRPKPPSGTVYVVGRITRFPAWEFKGVFTAKKRAIDACLDDRYFVGPAAINRPQPSTLQDWPGMEYPRAVESAA